MGKIFRTGEMGWMALVIPGFEMRGFVRASWKIIYSSTAPRFVEAKNPLLKHLTFQNVSPSIGCCMHQAFYGYRFWPIHGIHRHYRSFDTDPFSFLSWIGHLGYDSYPRRIHEWWHLFIHIGCIGAAIGSKQHACPSDGDIALPRTPGARWKRATKRFWDVNEPSHRESRSRG